MDHGVEIQTNYYLNILLDTLQETGIITNRHHLEYYQLQELKRFIRDTASIEFEFGYDTGYEDAISKAPYLAMDSL